MMGSIPTALTLGVISRESLLLILALPVATGVGFSLGILYERWYQASQLQRVRRKFEQLFEHVTKLLDQAGQACGTLQEQYSSRPISPPQQQRLQSLSARLMAHVKPLVERSGSASSSGDAPRSSRTIERVKPPQWTRLPLDARTGLPDAIAYAENLQLLQRSLAGTDTLCGALVVQIDDWDRLRQRYDSEIANDFVRQLGGRILRQLRDEDVLCQITDDCLIALLPQISRSELELLSQGARRGVRHGEYLHRDQQQPVFVTASLGFFLFGDEAADATDLAERVWQRGQQAIRAARKHGRCQLYEVTAAGATRRVAG